jgi:hypothetical protein
MKSEQLDFLEPAQPFVAPPPTTPTPDTIQGQFEQFHRLNPWIYRQLVALARDMAARGRANIGIGMLFEVMRWNYYRKTDDPSSEWKLNNNYRSRYARLIRSQEQDLKDAFELRELKSP